jgi:hypothetical protein
VGFTAIMFLSSPPRCSAHILSGTILGCFEEV